MARYVIDARTLLHVVAEGVQVNPRHQIVAPNLIRSHAMAALITIDPALARTARDVVPLAPLDALTAEQD